jgi:dihydrofolate reductase
LTAHSEVHVILIVAVAENGVIGAAGGLPWRVKADLRRFRALTMGKPMIMGRKTFESIGRVLDGRDSIVVTRAANLAAGGVVVAHGIEEALEIAAVRAAARRANEIAVIGGGEIFAATMPIAERLHVTHVAAEPEGDVFFPPISAADWVEVSREELPASEGDTAAAVYVLYERRR